MPGRVRGRVRGRVMRSWKDGDHAWNQGRIVPGTGRIVPGNWHVKFLCRECELRVSLWAIVWVVLAGESVDSARFVPGRGSGRGAREGWALDRAVDGPVGDGFEP